MCLVFVRSIDEHETCEALRVIRCKDANVETAAGRPDQHHRFTDSADVEEFSQLVRDAACCPGRRARIAVTHAGPVV